MPKHTGSNTLNVIPCHWYAKGVQSITRSCIVCRRETAKPQSQKMRKVPIESVTPNHTGTMFANVGIDYAGPVKMKYGSVRRPTVVKAYICVFVSLSVKAVHLEVVSDLTTDGFVACLRCFISRRGKPNVIWSDCVPILLEQQWSLKNSQSFYKRRKLKTLFPSSAHLSPLNGSLYQKEPLTLEVSKRLW